MTAKWWQGAMASLDSETTGVDLEHDRLVEICFALIRPTAPSAADRVTIRKAIVDPGIEVPAEAAAVHGYTTERVRAEGRPPAEVLDVFAADVALAVRSGTPLVVMNAPFDLTILDRECRRHGLPTVTDRLDGQPLAPVIDPLVIDTFVVPRRRRVSPTQGARQLKTLAQVWGVGWDDAMAHAAEYDALQAARVVWQICQRTPEIAAMSSMQLHRAQVGWRRVQQASFADWLRGQGKDASDVDGSWPLRPWTPAPDEEQMEVPV